MKLNAKVFHEWLLNHRSLKESLFFEDFNAKIINGNSITFDMWLSRIIREDQGITYYHNGESFSAIDFFLFTVLSTESDDALTLEIQRQIRNLLKLRLPKNFYNTHLFLLNETASDVEILETIYDDKYHFISKSFKNTIIQKYHLMYSGILHEASNDNPSFPRSLEAFIEKISAKFFFNMFVNFWVDIEKMNCHHRLVRDVSLQKLLDISGPSSKFYIPISLFLSNEMMMYENVFLKNVQILDYRLRKVLYQRCAQKSEHTDEEQRFLWSLQYKYEELLPDSLKKYFNNIQIVHDVSHIPIDELLKNKNMDTSFTEEFPLI